MPFLISKYRGNKWNKNKHLETIIPALFRNIPIIEDWMSDITFLDWAMVYQLSKFGKIRYLNFPAGVYRKHDRGVLTSLDKNNLETIKSQIREKLLEDYHLLSLK